MLPVASPSAADAPITVEFVDKSQPTLYLNGPVIRLGRSPTADVVFPPNDTAISANHAKLVCQNDELIVFDTESKNGVYVNGRRVGRAKLNPGDVVRLGPTGPELRFSLAASADRPSMAEALRQGLTLGMQAVVDMPSVGEAQVLGEFPLGPRALRVGRAEDCDVRLDSMHVSAHHAEVTRDGAGTVRVRDLGSTNGTFVGGARVADGVLPPGTDLVVGPFFLRYTGTTLRLFDTRGRSWIDVVDVEHYIGPNLILDGISLAVQPGEFVGFLGPSGAGKSMLLKSMCGSMRASGGRIIVNGLDFYENYAELKNLVGYVPQDDIIHTQLTVEDTLRYAAALRLPPELGKQFRDKRVLDVLASLELQNHRHLPAWRLSGGQRKRLSMGVELLTEPNLLYLDEPTAGLDPNLEEKMMVLFRELALRGKTVCCVTHVLDHIDLCDKIALLYGGRLAYFGKPAEALGYFGVRKLADAYHILEEHSPEHWRDEFRRRKAVPRTGAAIPQVTAPPPVRRPRQRSGPGPVRQLITLSARYARILTEDPKHTLILLLQAPILGVLIALATRGGQVARKPTSIMFLMLSLAAFWFGCVNAAREIVKEAPVTARERMVGVGVFPYVLSKFLVLQFLSLVQVAVLLLIVDWLGPPRQLGGEGGQVAIILGGVPGSYGFALVNLYLTAVGGIGLGLVISSLVDNSDKAMSMVPLALLPQILFANALDLPKSGTFTRIAGYVVGVNWSYDLFRREIACTPEEMAMKKVPECMRAWDPNNAGPSVPAALLDRELVPLIKDGLYTMERDLGVMVGMIVVFFLTVLVLQWRKKPV